MTNHGSRPLRGLESTHHSSITVAKFGRMFRWLEPAQDAKTAKEQVELEKLMKDLAWLMVTSEFQGNIDDSKNKDSNGNPRPDSPIESKEPADENEKIAAGYTYFGQFVDHDITFDPASALQQTNDPNALFDFRTPRLDLDCIYGSGPSDQPYLYDKKTGRNTFLLGNSVGIGGMDRPDLNRAKDHTALIGDKRNDENKIVAQVQALFLKFHNVVYAALLGKVSDEARFGEAQRIVRWSYQWVVLNDFLKKICREDIYNTIAPDPTKPRSPHLTYYNAHDEAFIPVEFAVAAYRFGHSMVRPSYALNAQASSTAKFKSKSGPTESQLFSFSRIPIFVGHSTNNRDALNGFGEPLPEAWGIDWDFFFGTPGKHPEGSPQIPQPSYRIDSRLVDPLGQLPEFVAQGAPSPFRSLAFRNLMRGASMGLPSGQRIAMMMGFDPMTDKQLWEKKRDGDTLENWDDGKALLAANGKWLKDSAPLWFYILKEAEMEEKGHNLGRVGSQIVAETLFGLAWKDHYSYLFQMPNWDPSLEKIGLPADLNMLSLSKFVNQ